MKLPAERLSVARDKLQAAGEHEVSLIKGKGGVFEIVVDGVLLFSKKKLGRFPMDEELLQLVQP